MLKEGRFVPSFILISNILFLLMYLEAAKKIIHDNWQDGFSIPTSKLYPFQWMWDSGFVALGTSVYDIKMSLTEINKMFSGQWENGMIPHILFHSEQEKTYFPNFDFWNSQVNDGAPLFPKSSGITQPAVYGFIIRDILEKHWGNNDVKEFVREVYPKVVNYHRFLYNYRDPHQEGLFFIYHPWESGRDNSPLWNESMNKIDIPAGSIPKYTRREF